MSRRHEIYLDDNATTRVLPIAAEGACTAMESLYGNPSSSHITGLQARRELESARGVAREVLGAETGRIIFTSGATEAIETAVFSALCALRQKGRPAERNRLLYGATEHKAVPQALRHWNDVLDLGCDVVAVPVDSHGQLDLDFLSVQIDEACLLCTMAVNNETGVIHNLPAVQHLLTRTAEKVAWIVDCVQAVGKLELGLAESAIDYACVSGHKIYAPKGIGLLYVREGAPFTPLLAGGGQERGDRGGTENLPGVAAIAAVLKALRDRDTDLFRDPETLAVYRDRLLDSLREAIPNIVFNTPFDRAVPTTINFSASGVTSKELLDLFDAAGVRVSSGSACGSAVRGSYVLKAMGLPKWRSDGAVRMSFGPATRASEIEMACGRIREVGAALKSSCLVDSRPTHDEAAPALDGLTQLKDGSDCSWILSDASTGKCVVIDPFEAMLERIESIISCQGLRVVAVLDTHLHIDHESPRESFTRRLRDHLVDQHAETDIHGWPSGDAGRVTLGDHSHAPVITLSESLVIARAPLPGHTIDSQAFLAGQPSGGRLDPPSIKYAFTGDTLLIGGIGRTDFDSSSADNMLESLRKLPRLISEESVVCPTHDYSLGFVTTLGSELRNNRFLARILDPVVRMSASEYLEIKRMLDAAIDDEANCELVCGSVRDYADQGGSGVNVEPEDLPAFFRQHRDSLAVDVRESHEHQFSQDWQSLGLAEPPSNVPLTRLGHFLATHLSSTNKDREVIFLCRSGSRSGKAAHAFRRLGLPAWHIAGGLALGASPGSLVLEAQELEYAI